MSHSLAIGRMQSCGLLSTTVLLSTIAVLLPTCLATSSTCRYAATHAGLASLKPVAWEENVLRFCGAPTISNLRLKLISTQLSMEAIALHNRRRCDDLIRLADRLAEFKDDVQLPSTLRSALSNYWEVVGTNGRACTDQIGLYSSTF